MAIFVIKYIYILIKHSDISRMRILRTRWIELATQLVALPRW